jgi:hypothetical protein
MHQQFNVQQLYALPTVYLCFVFISEQTATCATYSINWLVFITELRSVYSAVRIGSLNIAVFKRLKSNWLKLLPDACRHYTSDKVCRHSRRETVHASECCKVVWPQYVTCCMSSYSRRQFWDGSYILENLWGPCTTLYVITYYTPRTLQKLT